MGDGEDFRMMYILQPNKPIKEWHVGEEFPRITSKTAQFIVDGDELMFIIAALSKKQEPCGVAHEQEILKDVLKGL